MRSLWTYTYTPPPQTLCTAQGGGRWAGLMRKPGRLTYMELVAAAKYPSHDNPNSISQKRKLRLGVFM